MNEIMCIDGDISLLPNDLHNWREILVTNLKKKYITCNKQYGYITDILKISNKIRTEIESDNSSVKFYVKFTVSHILPKIGKILTCTVHMLFSHGIFAAISDKIKILVPAISLVDYTFDNKEGHFISSNKETVISKNDTIDIEIVEIKYEKNRYNCIGKLK